MDPRRLLPLLVIVAIAAAIYLSSGSGPVGVPASPRSPGPSTLPRSNDSPTSRDPRGPSTPSRDATGYDPASASAKDAIPGGGLSAHEGLGGSHTLERHVGRSVEDLKRRAERESKREVSTFPDVETADKAVGEVLYRHRADVRRWLARRPSGNEAFESRLDQVAGKVYLRSSDRVVDGRSVVVVIRPSDRFPEGFLIVTAYVSTP